MNEDLTGRVAESRAGRDKGRFLLIIGQEGEYLFLADGKLRKLSRPKRKKRRHVFLRPETAEGLREALEKGLPVNDRELEKALIALGYNNHKE